ncbi:MAG TPA: choice-of-anchor B family protein [Calditrichia bacterium]|nr:choice-of-anchor B family protein [Calditrichota bacterium]HQV31567.1 choice-of-anchor B family protein [Calditrichia bacterium]
MQNFLRGFFVSLFLGSCLVAQTYSLSFVADVTFPSSNAGCGSTPITGGSDVWGYQAPDGTQYALMGVRDGIAVVRIPDMMVVEVVPAATGADCYWHRDIKTYGHYAYAVAEMSGGVNPGMLIMDLQFLPDSVRLVGTYQNGSDIRSHNLSIDTATGYAYVLKQNASGVRVISLADPENPVDVSVINTSSVHDVLARNDTVYVSEGGRSSFSVWDLSDKNNPTFMTRFFSPDNGYAHNAWPTEDGRYVMTTEETRFVSMKMWDVSDMLNPALRGEILGRSDLAHNTHILGNLAYISHYTSGVSIVDLSNPDTLRQVAEYDTYQPSNSPIFDGCWGVYPFADSGYVYASNFDGRLLVLRLTQEVLGTGGDPLPIPENHALLPNFPNPFNPETTIPYRLSERGEVRVEIFNVSGGKVRVLVNEVQSPGDHRIRWDGRDNHGREMASGTYLVRLSARGGRPFEVTRPVVLVK